MKMKVKVTLRGFCEEFRADFFNCGGDFHRGINTYLQIVLGRENSCEQIDANVVLFKDGDIPRHFFADYVLPVAIGDVEKLRQLAALLGDLFREYVFAFVDCGAFVGVRVADGVHTVKWSPHPGAQR